jgi:hypothetical protein
MVRGAAMQLLCAAASLLASSGNSAQTPRWVIEMSATATP